MRVNQKPIGPRQLIQGRRVLERLSWHLRGDEPAHGVVRRLIENIDRELLEREQRRLREKGYEFP